MSKRGHDVPFYSCQEAKWTLNQTVFQLNVTGAISPKPDLEISKRLFSDVGLS
jgi:hypothetical protein